jgi:glycosyltransferase involved in cell wall biosynthesis
LSELITDLLRRAARHPERSLASIADDLMTAMSAAPLKAFPNPPFIGALEEPTQMGRVEYCRLSVVGWLTHRTAKITRLTAIVDPLSETTLEYGIARADIAGKFPDLAAHANAAFEGKVDLPAGLNRPVLLKIFATLDNGEKHLAFAQRFQPGLMIGAVPTAPPLSVFPFCRAVWTLRGAASRLGLPTAGVVRAGRATWAHYPGKPLPKTAATQATTNRAQPLRIVVVTHNLNFEGAPRLVFELASFVQRQPGISVRVISPSEGPLRALFENAGMAVTVLDVAPAIRAANPEEFRARLAALSNTINWREVDLVLANTLVSFWAVHLAHHARKPALFYVHESAPIPRLFAPLVAPALIPVVAESLTLAQRVVFTADASRQVHAVNQPRANFRVLPSWLDAVGIGRFAAQHDRAALRAKHGFAPDAVVLLNLGTVCERKGQHVFLQAAEILEPEFRANFPEKKIEFVMVGARDDDFLRAMKTKAADARLQTVRFVPETRENYDFLHLADVLVCTSFEESSPRVLLEAAAFGTLIVSTDVNGIPEMFGGEEAILIEPGDRYLLAAAIRQALAAHRAGDTRRAELALNRTQRFDERVSLPQHLALIRETAALAPGGTAS